MAYTVRRALVFFSAVSVLSYLASGCSSASSEVGGVTGTSGQGGSAAIGVQLTSPLLTVVVENRAGRPLVDVSVSIRAGTLAYSTTVPRIEPNDKRALNPNEFRAQGGGMFNPSAVRAKEIVVAAKDLDGKTYEVTTPWKQ
jgi:hypothetical protein